ncbi:MAG: MFS transporter, partial [Promethearchaeota archaeon]
AGMFAAWLTNFYIKVIQINPLLWGLAWIAYFGWNAINDPLIGYFGDRTRTRFGRRIPWLMVATPLLSISMIVLFFPPILDPSLESSQLFYFFWLLIALLLYDTFYTIIGILQNALVAELSILPQERGKAGLFWASGTLTGQLITFILPFFLIVNQDPYSQNLPIFQGLTIIFALIGVVSLAFMSFGIKEKKEFMYAKEDKLGFWESIKITIVNKGFIYYTCFTFMLVFVHSTVYSQVSFYVQDVLQISSQNILSSLPILAFVISNFIGYPVGLLFNRKFGGKKAIIYLSISVIIGLSILTFVSDFILSILLLLFIGIGYAGVGLLAPILMADVIDEDELNTGKRREGAYYGSTALFTKPSQSIAAAVTGLIFALTGYDQDATTQSIVAQFGIKLNIGLIPALILLLGILLLTKFPIDASTKRYQEMKKTLEELHDTKLEKLKSKL